MVDTYGNYALRADVAIGLANNVDLNVVPAPEDVDEWDRNGFVNFPYANLVHEEGQKYVANVCVCAPIYGGKESVDWIAKNVIPNLSKDGLLHSPCVTMNLSDANVYKEADEQADSRQAEPVDRSAPQAIAADLISRCMAAGQSGQIQQPGQGEQSAADAHDGEDGRNEGDDDISIDDCPNG